MVMKISLRWILALADGLKQIKTAVSTAAVLYLTLAPGTPYEARWLADSHEASCELKSVSAASISGYDIPCIRLVYRSLAVRGADLTSSPRIMVSLYLCAMYFRRNS